VTLINKIKLLLLASLPGTSLMAQIPANDDCAFAQVIIIPDDGDTCISGTLTNASGDGIYNPCDSITINPLPPGGHEVWFTYIATGTDNIITATPSGATPAQFLSVTIPSGNCTNSAYYVCNNASGPGGSASVSWSFTAGTQVWFSVTALFADGDFNVCVTSVTPPPIPAPGVGVDCSSAIPICDKHTFISPGPVFNNATGAISCYPFGPQNILWYKFTAGTSDSLIWMATPNPGYELDWSLNDITAGCPGITLACNYATTPGGGGPTGMASGSVTPCGPLSQICTPIVLTAGNTYALHFNIENFLNAGIDTPAIRMEWGGIFKMAPYSDFTIINGSGCDTVTAIFVNNSISASGYQWDFGNGNTSNQQNPPNEIYTVPGTYAVSLVTTSPLGCASVASHAVTVFPKPDAAFQVSDTILCLGLNDTVNYSYPSNPNHAYNWSFGGGTVVSGTAGSSGPYVISWNTPGIKNIQLTVTDNTTGCSSVAYTKIVDVIAVPDSTFTVPSGACEGEIIAVTFSGIQNPGNNYTWDFGSANVISGSGPGPYQISFTASGVYDIALLVDLNGCASDDTNTVTVTLAPSAFTGNDTAVCSGQSVQLGQPASPGQNYSWTPGINLSDSTLADPLFLFVNNQPADDTLQLILSTNAGGCSAEDTISIIVRMNITSAFTISDDTLCGNESATVNYSGNAQASSGFNWDFGAGNAVNTGVQQYQISWSSAANDTVSLFVTENGCSSDTTVMAVVAGDMPVADAGADKSFCSGETDTIGTAAVPGVTYSWFPVTGLNNSTQSDPAVSIVNSLTVEDTMTYVLTAVSGFCSNTDTVNVIVRPVQLADITGPVTACINNNSLQFTNASPQVSGGVFSWDFGNAVPSSSIAYIPVPVSFPNTGPQWIYLNTSGNGCIPDNDSLLVTIYPVPSPGFTVAGSSGCPPLTVSFTDTTQAQGGSSFFWDFGNGDTSSLQNPQCTFMQPGSYDVSLTVTTPDTCFSTYISIGAVQVFDLPQAQFTASPPVTSIINPSISFINQSLNADSCYYLFGDGQSSTLCDVVHTYQDTGSYLVYLITTSGQGCIDTAEQIVTIDALESIYVANAFTPNNDGHNDVFLPAGTPVSMFHLEIYNRWGQLIFISNMQGIGWDGSDVRSGVEAPGGLYVYNLSFVNLSGEKKQKSGVISLIR